LGVMRPAPRGFARSALGSRRAARVTTTRAQPRALLRVAYGLAVALAAAPARASRPLVTDDARVLAPGACQFETWTRTGDEGTEYWALPACSLLANLEMTAGVGVLPAERGAGPSRSVVQLQAKTLFRTLETGRVAFGLVAGGLLRAQDALDQDLQADLLGEAYAFAPITVTLGADRAWLHLNVGVRYRGEGAGTLMLWGVAAEVPIVGPVVALAEAYGDAPGPVFMQAGLRVTLVPDRIQIEKTYGRGSPDRGDDQWATVGLRLLSPPLFEPLGGLDWSRLFRW